MKILIIVAATIFLAGAVYGIIFLTAPSNFTGENYTIPTLDLSTMPKELKGTEYEYLYDLVTVDDSYDYMAHPDSILLDNGNILIATANPEVMENYIKKGDMVIVGNRYESQLSAIESGAGCILVCLGGGGFPQHPKDRPG